MLHDTEGRRSVIFAITGDIHNGGNRARYGDLVFLSEQVRDFRSLGVDGVVVAGDISQNGEVSELRECAQAILNSSETPVYVTTGNHDWLLESQNVVENVLQEAGAVVLDDRLTIQRINGVIVGFTGINGSVPRETMVDLKRRFPRRRDIWTPVLQAVTQEMYGDRMTQVLDELRVSGVDVAMHVGHVPTHEDFYPAHVQNLPETSPLLREVIHGSGLFSVEVASHVHSKRKDSLWRVPRIVSQPGEKTLRISVPVETALQEGRDIFTFVELLPHEVARVISRGELATRRKIAS